MHKKGANKKVIYIFIFILVCFVFVLFQMKTKAADPYSNMIKIKDAKITSIKTGAEDFDNNDGLDYTKDVSAYYAETGYIAGNDATEKNRIVRSFDVIKYDFSFSIEGKTTGQDFEDRKVSITTILSDEEKKYIAAESSLVVSIPNINTRAQYTGTIVLYVTGAPNGFKIDPKFEIKESTDTETQVYLGKVDEKHNYEYENGEYKNVSSLADFKNYMPTIVSSKSNSINVYVKSATENPSTIYNGKNGRYMNFVVGLELIGDVNKGIKGSTIPEGDISFDFTVDQNSLFDSNWVRLYSNENLNDIPSVKMSSPYGVKVNSDNSVYSNDPGTIKITKNDDGSYKATISDYKINSIYFPIKNADNSSISNSNAVFGSYSLILFSERTNESGKEDIYSEISIFGLSGQNTLSSTLGGQSLVDINKNDNVAKSSNVYYETSDYTLKGSFVEFNSIDTKLSKDGNGTGATSKGSEIAYKSTFNYSKASSDTGVKQIIKVDPVAFRVISMSYDEDIKLELKCNGGKCKNIKEDDFEVNFVTGDYNLENYSIDNSSVDTLNTRLLEEDKEIIQNQCNTISSNLSQYTSNQVMNLYGGPCISANENVESIYKNISDAIVEENNEIPITKIVIQTKKGVKLPDYIEITVTIGLRVRNVSDITQTYPVTTMAMTSDYDEKLIYYAPRVTNDENSVTSPSNYKKSIYNGNILVSTSDNTWGDSLKIVNYTARNTINVLNTNQDGTVKTTYSMYDNDTIKYKIETNIEDYSETVGADDTWWINSLNITVTLPNTLEYIDDQKIGKPTVIYNDDGTTTLIYILPYTKPNMKIDDIKFNTKLRPNIVGSKNPVQVISTINAINVNGEIDTSIVGSTSSSYTIYATGADSVIMLQKSHNLSGNIGKNQEFSYLLSAYNNTSTDAKLNIIDILPYNGDKNGSSFSGSYKVKVVLPSGQQDAKVYCSTQKSSELINEVNNTNNIFEECEITNEYVSVTAIKIEGLIVARQSYLNDIQLLIKPENNEYSDKYNNIFYGKATELVDTNSNEYIQTKSNQIDVGVINRYISGRVFIDNNSDGIEDEADKYLKDIPVTLYELDSNNEMSKVAETITNDKGEYKFKGLDTGRYKIQLKYDDSKYDLTLRYAYEDSKYDSDAYKISDDGLAEISGKNTPDEVVGIRITDNIQNVTDMNIGLIPRYTFGFEMKKYITKIELNSNNVLSTIDYNNESRVSISVKNSAKSTARIYYGISITNNSATAGYIKLVQEDIPEGLLFDANDEYNKQWFELNGSIYSKVYEDDIVKPDETKYLQIVLDMPRREEAGTFLNTTSIVEMQAYEESNINENVYTPDDEYRKGDNVNYAGISWHVINVDGDYLTLLADSDTISNKMSHKSSGNYKWSESEINNYINNKWQSTNSLNLPILLDNEICDDASGLFDASYGGTLKIEGKCQSEIYNTYKVRLLTETEYKTLMNDNFEDKSWLSGDYWLMNSSYVVPEYDEFGVQTNSVTNMAKAVIGTNVQDKKVTNELEVRPVITVSSSNVIME